MQQLTREARYLLSVNNDLNFSGAVDMRPLVDSDSAQRDARSRGPAGYPRNPDYSRTARHILKITALMPRAWRSWRRA